MVRKMKTSILGIFGYLAFTALIARSVFKIDYDNIIFIDVINVLLLIVFILMIIRRIIYPYILINETSITIYRDFFFKEIIPIKNISEVSIKSGFFTKSYFKLVNGKEVKFDDSPLSEGNIKKLKPLC